MAQQGPAPQQQAAVVPVPPAYNQWRKTIQEYTHHLIPCDGTNKTDVRGLIDVFDAMRRWTNIPEAICLTALGSLTKEVLRDGIYHFLEANQALPIGWADVKIYIQNAYLEDDEPDYQRKELERSQQGAFEGIKEYSKGFQRALGRAYTPLQLLDPVHLARVIRSYIRGIYTGEVREKVYDSQPVTLQNAIDSSHIYATSKKLRAERNGPRMENDAFPCPEPRRPEQQRREEAMDVGYLTQSAPFPLPLLKKTEPLHEKYEGLDKRMKTLQKQMTAMMKAQEKQQEEMKEYLQKNVENQRGQRRQWSPPQDRQRNPPQDRPWYPPQERPDRRKWDASGKPYCLRCGVLGHMIRECAALAQVDTPQDQGN